MELRQLRYFVGIARCGSFSAAASVLRIAQPALSTQIIALERELGRALFTRHARGVRLTPDGMRFLEHAAAILARVDEARQAFGLERGGAVLEVTLGMTPLISKFLAVPVIEAVARQAPHISVGIIEGMSGALRDWLESGKIGLSFSLNLAPDDPFYMPPMISEDLYVLSSRESTFLTRSEIDERDLIRLPMIVSTPKNGHRILLESIARRHGVRLPVVAEVDSIPRQRELVAMGRGVLVIPLAGWFDWDQYDLRSARLVGDDIRWETSLVPSGSHQSIEALRVLRPIVHTLVQDLVDSGRWPGARLAQPR